MRAPDGTPLHKVRPIIGFSHKKVQATGTNEADANAEFNHGNANEIRFKLKGRQPEKIVSVKEYFLAGEFPTKILRYILIGP